MDELGLVCLDLLSEVADVGLDDVAVAVEVVVPDVIENLGLGDNPALVDEQESQQAVLRRRERDLGPAAGHAMGVIVHGEVGKFVGTCRSGVGSAAQDRFRSSHELLEAEGLGEVVIGPDGETSDSVGGVVLGREEQHWGVVCVGAESSAHFEAIEVGHHDVEHDEVWAFALHGDECAASVGGLRDLEAVVRQRGAQHGAEVVFVIDDEEVVPRHLGIVAPEAESFLRASESVLSRL